ncbi:bifunctional DNA primase/polymerase [Nocardia suismassiliense]|uniref:Bifunctional DNA primase/polymerase n=1 Tax=Nocardia suismassiliense TaxID=2077092 RepID=A0ABW6R714_9NOCA
MTTLITAPDPGLLETAIETAGRGFHVFPLHPGTKVPVIKRWEANATTDCERISRWWRRWPADNVGLACGPSGLHVLDLDTGRGHRTHSSPDLDGRQVLSQLAARLHQPLPVPTYTVHTPSFINRSVGVLFNVINDWSRRVFASLIHCYQGVCNNEAEPIAPPGSEDR